MLCCYVNIFFRGDDVNKLTKRIISVVLCGLTVIGFSACGKVNTATLSDVFTDSAKISYSTSYK